MANLVDQSCFNYLDRHFIDEASERYLLNERKSYLSVWS